jgi:hypothetical protein
MKVKQLFALTALALAGSAVLADQAPGAPLTRAEVVQSVLDARAAGTLDRSEVSEFPEAATAGTPSTVTRAQVQADTQQALAAGTLDRSDVSEFPEAAMAGLPSTVSRSEVLADLQIYRESGLADLNRSEATRMNPPAYARAEAKYAQLRASSYYATLVQRIAAQRGETVTLSKR